MDLTVRDTQQAFRDAIRKGEMNQPEEYMYMYSDGLTDYFKHRVTREYLVVAYDDYIRYV